MLTLPTLNIPHYMAAGRHVALLGLAWYNIDYFIEEKCLSVLAPKALIERVSR